MNLGIFPPTFVYLLNLFFPPTVLVLDPCYI